MTWLPHLTRRQALALAGAGAASLVSAVSHAAAARPVVVELFTSQGCSSCPPADALLGQIKTMPGVFALSYNVDYWDYLGWHDSLASPDYSQRQYDYAKSRGDMDVYTPQIVVDGARHYVGSNRQAVLGAIRKSQSAGHDDRIAMTLSATESEVAVDVAAGRAPGPEATLWLMPIVPQVTVAIERGENAGSQITYYNVVRKMVPAGMWKGESQHIVLPRSSLIDPECKSCVALLQRGKVGPVIGAASWGEINA